MNSANPRDTGLHLPDPIDLFRLCAAERENTGAWSEFLNRYAVKLKYFIRSALRQVYGYSGGPNESKALGGLQESDLFQNAIVRLVENDCAAMKRFSGTSENELLAYLAVICRSSVLDTLRRSSALKRRRVTTESEACPPASAWPFQPMSRLGFEREILAREVVSLTQNAIQSHAHSRHISDRDQLVFELHFLDGLSYSQIAQCSGINLSKAGVEKLLKRLVGQVQTLASSGKSEEIR